MGGLRIYAEEDILFSPKPITRVLWEKFENQENEWHTESVNFTRTPTPTSGSQVKLQYVYGKLLDIAACTAGCEAQVSCKTF